MKLMVLSQTLVVIGYIGSDWTDLDTALLDIVHDCSSDVHGDIDNLDILHKKQEEGRC